MKTDQELFEEIQKHWANIQSLVRVLHSRRRSIILGNDYDNYLLADTDFKTARIVFDNSPPLSSPSDWELT